MISLDLKRYPVRARELLQAWDSADELIIRHVNESDPGKKRILIVNDSFGALSAAFIDKNISVFTDSFVSSEAIQLNTKQKITPLHDLDQLHGIYDLVLLKIPKNLSFLEDILCCVSSHLSPESKLIAGCMVKHLPKTAFNLIDKYFGQTSTSLAEKKARLIFANFQRQKVSAPLPSLFEIPGFSLPICHYSNLFSRNSLDIGTRFFLEYLPKGDYQKILDLGCGSGIIGLSAKKMNLNSSVVFSDDSFMAVKSAEENYKKFFKDEARFVWTNGYESQEKESLDLILCNPPFHQENVILDSISNQMFLDSHASLKMGGTLRLIGNSHLFYQAKLKKIFGVCEVVAKNNKFTIMDATK